MSINLSINLPTSTPSHNASETGQAGELKRPAPMTRFLSLPTLSHDGGSRPVAKARLKVWKPSPPNNPQIALRRAVQRVVARVKTCRQHPPGAGRLADADRSETARRILNRFLQQLPGSPCTEPFTRALVSQTAVVKKPRMQTAFPRGEAGFPLERGKRSAVVVYLSLIRDGSGVGSQRKERSSFKTSSPSLIRTRQAPSPSSS